MGRQVIIACTLTVACRKKSLDVVLIVLVGTFGNDNSNYNQGCALRNGK